jgi:hypothetical protein
MIILPVGVEMFHADGQAQRETDGRTDRQLIVAFRYFAKAPKIYGGQTHTLIRHRFHLPRNWVLRKIIGLQKKNAPGDWKHFTMRKYIIYLTTSLVANIIIEVKYVYSALME